MVVWPREAPQHSPCCVHPSLLSTGGFRSTGRGGPPLCHPLDGAALPTEETLEARVKFIEGSQARLTQIKEDTLHHESQMMLKDQAKKPALRPSLPPSVKLERPEGGGK